MALLKPQIRRGTKLFARIAFKFDGVNYRPGEQFDYMKMVTVPWRKVLQLYNIGKIVEADVNDGLKVKVDVYHTGGGWYMLFVENNPVLEKPVQGKAVADKLKRKMETGKLEFKIMAAV